MRPLPVYDSDSAEDADATYDIPPPPPTPQRDNRTPGIVTTSSTIDPDSYDKSRSNARHRSESKYGWHLELTSILLFILGSVMYLVCAVYDYQWSQTLLELPEWLRGADDDEIWMRYRLEEKYGDVSNVQAPSERMLGGVRRRLMRQNYWVSGAYHDVNQQFFDPTQNESSASQRKLQQTPEELYYDLDWSCLPQSIRNAYKVLGYTQNAWDNELEVATDSMDWYMLTPEQQEAALFIGYTEMAWCEYDDAWVPEIGSPTFVPSRVPTLNPTIRPSKRPTGNPTNVITSPLVTTDSPTFELLDTISDPTSSLVTTFSPAGEFISSPSSVPTTRLTSAPSSFPSLAPSASPSMASLSSNFNLDKNLNISIPFSNICHLNSSDPISCPEYNYSPHRVYYSATRCRVAR